MEGILEFQNCLPFTFRNQPSVTRTIKNAHPADTLTHLVISPSYFSLLWQSLPFRPNPVFAQTQSA